MHDAPLRGVNEHSMDSSVNMLPRAIGQPEASIKPLQISRVQFLNWDRAETRNDVLAQQLSIARERLMADVLVRPVVQPPFDEISHRLPARIDVLAGGKAGDNFRRLGLRLRLGAV